MKAIIWRTFQILSGIVAIGVLGFATYSTVHFLQTSPRLEVKKVLVTGQKRVAETQVLAQADLADGVNIFTVDLDGIRQRVEKLQWVQHALVHRVLPDAVAIELVEREPVGLARIRGEIRQFDAYAELLDLDPEAGVNLPVLDGLRSNDREGNLPKIALYRKILEELQGQRELSEIRITDAAEVSVVPQTDSTIVNLGTDDFRAKWGRYVQLRPQIQLQYPEAAQVDFRFRNLVVLKPRADAPEEENVVWDEKKKSL